MATRWTEADLAKLKLAWHAPRRTATQLPVKRPSKYGNVKATDATGVVHDSGKEFRRYQELQLREIAGEITNLRHHVLFACVVEGEHICDYEADFVYREGAAVIVEDVKPKDSKFRKTAAYRLFRVKQKLAQALHKLQIREV